MMYQIEKFKAENAAALGHFPAFKESNWLI
jgi:hypothetical protein